MKKIVYATAVAFLLASSAILAEQPWVVFTNKLLVQDEGVNVLPQHWTLNFTGAGANCIADNSNGRITCDFSGGGAGGGASVDNQYWVGAPAADLTAEHNLGGFTALVLNTLGTPSAYTGVDCTNQFIRDLTGSGAGTCATVVGGDFGSQTANFFFAAPNGSAGNPAFRAIVDDDVPNTVTLTNITQITNRAISDTTGTLAIERGGTGQITATAAFDALAPTTTKGDTSVYNGTNNVRFPAGLDGQFLRSNSATATGWEWVTGPNVSEQLNDANNSSNVTTTFLDISFIPPNDTWVRLDCTFKYQTAAIGTGIAFGIFANNVGLTAPPQYFHAKISIDGQGAAGTDSTFVGNAQTQSTLVISSGVTSVTGTPWYDAEVSALILTHATDTGDFITVIFRSEVNASQVTVKEGSSCIAYVLHQDT